MGAGGRAAGRLAVIGYRGKSSEFPPEGESGADAIRLTHMQMPLGKNGPKMELGKAARKTQQHGESSVMPAHVALIDAAFQAIQPIF